MRQRRLKGRTTETTGVGDICSCVECTSRYTLSYITCSNCDTNATTQWRMGEKTGSHLYGPCGDWFKRTGMHRPPEAKRVIHRDVDPVDPYRYSVTPVSSWSSPGEDNASHTHSPNPLNSPGSLTPPLFPHISSWSPPSASSNNLPWYSYETGSSPSLYPPTSKGLYIPSATVIDNEPSISTPPFQRDTFTFPDQDIPPPENTKICTHCFTKETTIWRETPECQALCNTCASFLLELHGAVGPLSLITKIKKRKRKSEGSQPDIPTTRRKNHKLGYRN
jgi:hypothetical protein